MPAKKSHNILIVDDDLTVCLLLREALEQTGYSVIEASTGLQAIELFKSNHPDLVLLDVGLPDIDGFEVCKTIHQINAQIPVVMVTGHDDMKSVEQAFEVSASDFINKPINWGLLPHRVHFILKANHSIHEERNIHKMLTQILDTIPVRVFWKDLSLKYLGCNQLLAEDAGFNNPEQIIGKSDHDLPWHVCAPQYEKTDQQVLHTQMDQNCPENPHPVASGKHLRIHCKKTLLKDPQGETIGILGSYEDITLQRKAEEKIQHLAHFDSLTGLPNRVLFHDRLKHALVQSDRNEYLLALLFIDLDKFKIVNDSLGHQVGDQLLIASAARLKQSVRHGDTVARLGGDEFTIILEMVKHCDACELVANKILNSFKKPFIIGDNSISITPSIGIATYPFVSENQDDLIRCADTAMYEAKKSGRNNYRYYCTYMGNIADDNFNKESALRMALSAQEFELWYQPQCKSDNGQISGVEALLRWRKSDGQLVMPDEFIPTLEETGLIIEVGEWVLKTACNDASRWQQQGLNNISVAVNLSSRQFNDVALVDKVRNALQSSGLSPQQLELEITESNLIGDHLAVASTLRELKMLGIKISLDDFGTGYSSLNYIKTLPFDIMKIDRSFIREIPDDHCSNAITKTIITLAKTLGLDIVAEGVETLAQYDCLQQQGDMRLQGYLLRHPLPKKELLEYLMKSRLKGIALDRPEV